MAVEPEARRRAHEWLQEVYQKTHGFDLEFLKDDAAAASKLVTQMPFLGLSGASFLLWLASGKQLPVHQALVRVLDRLGQPITSNANLDLRRTAQVDPISEPLHWRGEFRYLADSATFTDCASGLRWPVATTADYLTMERNYLQSRSTPGAPLLVSFDGRIEVLPAMEGPPREQMVVDRFGSSQPGAACGSEASDKGNVMVELKDTYWKLVELDGARIVTASPQKREVRITLASEGSRVIGFSGCNQFTGGYTQDGNTLRFTQMAGTQMACVPPVIKLESQVLKMLNATTGYHVEGEHLTLLADTQVLARFGAV
jgi:heat shock protein HslJ